MEYYFFQRQSGTEETDRVDLNRVGYDVKKFLRDWERWCEEFPGTLKLVTMVSHSSGGNFQLRFWFGEPEKIQSHHVDSMGRNLIATINDRSNDELLYMLFVEYLLRGSIYTKESTTDGLTIWRLQ